MILSETALIMRFRFITYMTFIHQANKHPLLVSIHLNLADIIDHRRHDDDFKE